MLKLSIERDAELVRYGIENGLVSSAEPATSEYGPTRELLASALNQRQHDQRADFPDNAAGLRLRR